MIFSALPIDPATLVAYIVTVSAIVVSPGPDTMIVLRYAMASGRSVGVASIVGVQVGLLVHTTLAVLGISLIITSSPVLFKSVAVAGAAYLGWLGIQAFRAGGGLRLTDGAPIGHAKACRDAVLCNLLNPKIILLFLALLPNFVDAGRDNVTTQLIFLAAVLIVINVLWQLPLAWAADAIGRWLAIPGAQQWVERGTGTIFLAFAGLMLWEHLL